MASLSGSYMLVALLCVVPWLAVAAHAPGTTGTSRRAMPWLCLERCSDNIANDMRLLKQHHSNLTAVSYEAFDVAADGGLLDNNFTDITADVLSMGLEAWPMVTTVDIYELQLLFNNPEPFISAAVQRGMSSRYTGYNLDFEPCQYVRNCTHDDAVAYAAFLTQFADALHAHGMKLSCDIATWSPFWDFELIAASHVDRVLLMTTYTSDFTVFQTALTSAVQTIGVAKLGVGLCDSCAKSPLSPADMAMRFDAIDKSGAVEVDVWDWPMPSFWWEFVGTFVHAPDDAPVSGLRGSRSL